MNCYTFNFYLIAYIYQRWIGSKGLEICLGYQITEQGLKGLTCNNSGHQLSILTNILKRLY